MRPQTKLNVINDYPRDKRDYRKKDEVLKASIRYISKKTTIKFFLALTMLGNGFEYRVNRIANDTGLTKPQISDAKNDCIKLGLISICETEGTITINYNALSDDFKNKKVTNVENKNIETYKKPVAKIKFSNDFCEEFGDEYPDCLGGGKIYESN